MLRTHTCGELNASHIGQPVSLSGWVDSFRNLGGLIFLNLRDRYGSTQVALDPKDSKPEILDILTAVRSEWVLSVKGTVVARPKEMINAQMSTGEIEVKLESVEVLNKSLPLPFELNDEKNGEANEALRLKYRFLDLRRPKLQEMLKAKDQAITFMREYFHGLGFVEVQTPILANSSPEGARDFLVPSRLYPGRFYALPQAPQQFKQLLMVGGVDRYFQIAPCFRDEDPRMDRHYGEFYQLDMEMSFVEQEDIFKVMEPLMIQATEKFSAKKIMNLQENGRFIQISWKEAMEKYGSDKPDLRFDWEIKDISEIVSDCGFSVFEDTVKDGGAIKALRIPGGGKYSRKEIDGLVELAKQRGAKGLAYGSYKEGKASASFSKFISEDKLGEIFAATAMAEGDLLLIVADKWREACSVLGALRNRCGEDSGAKDNSLAAWAWIVDFPMFDYSEIEEGRVDFAHNPFSMPQGGLDALNNQEPLSILAYQYDLILNGFEISSGAIRNHDPEIMYKAFSLAGYSKEQVDSRFGAMIRAFSYGAPPHGGNAPGLDRLLMVLNDWDSIRDMYAFPKDSQGRDLMSDSPNVVDDIQLKELKIKIEADNKKK